MVLTLSVVHIPGSDAIVVTLGVFVTPSTSSGGGSQPSPDYTVYFRYIKD